MTRPTAYHHGDLANALLDAVRDIIDEQGLMGVSLREAARRAGVSHSAPAHHFGDKNGLLVAFAKQGFEMLAAEMVASFTEEQDRPLRDQLRTLGRTYLRFAVAHPAHYEVMFRVTTDHANHAEGGPLHEAAEQTFLSLAVLVNQLGQDGVIDPDRGRYMATMLWGACHGVASMWLDGVLPHFYEDHTVDELIDGVVDTMTAVIFD
jgi:AcrR family transcriptional regulator